MPLVDVDTVARIRLSRRVKGVSFELHRTYLMPGHYPRQDLTQRSIRKECRFSDFIPTCTPLRLGSLPHVNFATAQIISNRTCSKRFALIASIFCLHLPIPWVGCCKSALSFCGDSDSYTVQLKPFNNFPVYRSLDVTWYHTGRSARSSLVN